MAHQFKIIVGAVDDGAGGVAAEAAVNHEVHEGAVFFEDEVGVGHVFIQRILIFADGGADDGVAQLLYQLKDDLIVGDADADGFTLLAAHAGGFRGCFKDEGERTGQGLFQHLVGGGGDAVGVVGNVR